MKTLVKVLAIIIIILAALVGAGFYGLFHTALPAKVLLGILQKGEPMWTFEEISGSISSGFTIGEVTYTSPEDSSKVSSFKNIGFEYEKNDNILTIKSIHLASGYLYVNPNGDDFKGIYSKETRSEEEEVQTTSEQGFDPYENKNKNEKHPIFEKVGIQKLIVENIDINDITIEDPATGQKTHFAKIKSTGFTVSADEFLFGSFDVEGEHVSVKVHPIDDIGMNNFGTVIAIEGRVDDIIHTMVNKEISFSCTLDCKKLPAKISAFTALDRKIQLSSESDDKKSFIINDLSFNDYVSYDGIPPFKNLNLKGSYHFRDGRKTGLAINGGDFRLGDAFFIIEDATIDMENSGSPDNVVTAKATSGGIDYTMKVTSAGNMKFDFSSSPAMTQEEIRARLKY